MGRPFLRESIVRLRIPVNLGGRSSVTWAPVPLHLGADGAERRSGGQVVVDWSLERSQSASAMVGSASISCQLFSGTCDVITVEECAAPTLRAIRALGHDGVR